MRKWIWTALLGCLLIATLAATGFHVSIEVFHHAKDVGAMLEGMKRAHQPSMSIAFMDGGERGSGIVSGGHLDMSPRSGGIVGDPRDGFSGGGGGQPSGHGASGSWGRSEVTDTWGVHVELGWDRGPRGSVGADFEHSSTHGGHGD
jgi:hypothetical protein